MPGCKLVTNLWNLDSSALDLGEQIITLILGDHYRIYDTALGMSQHLSGISRLGQLLTWLLTNWLNDFSNDRVISTYLCAWADESVRVELVIWALLKTLGQPHIWLLNGCVGVIGALIAIIVSSEEN